MGYVGRYGMLFEPEDSRFQVVPELNLSGHGSNILRYSS